MCREEDDVVVVAAEQLLERAPERVPQQGLTARPELREERMTAIDLVRRLQRGAGEEAAAERQVALADHACERADETAPVLREDLVGRGDVAAAEQLRARRVARRGAQLLGGRGEEPAERRRRAVRIGHGL